MSQFKFVDIGEEVDKERTDVPCGEYTLRLIGRFEMPFDVPVTLSVSSSISFMMDKKSMNFLPLQCKNSPYSVGPLISCRMRGRRVTIPEPRGRKSLGKRTESKEGVFSQL